MAVFGNVSSSTAMEYIVKTGTATLVAGTILIPATELLASHKIFITVQPGGAIAGRIRVNARVNGVSFTVTSTTATDNCAIAYQITT